jgi:flavin-dependent dehydrogenase
MIGGGAVDSVRPAAYCARVTHSADPCDVLVIGGGPAGSTAAQLLASWGWSVVMAHRDPRAPAAHPTLAESLPSSTRKLFSFLGQLDRIEAAGFHPNEGNVARWAEASRVTRTSDAGFHVSRAAFDRVLRACAVGAGACLLDAVVRQVDVSDPIRVTYATPDNGGNGPTSCSARYVLDCSGRAGVLARRGLRRADAQYRTLAIAAEWECDAWPAGERAQTVVESYRDGWAWSVPLSATRRQCTVMIDPDRSPNRLASQAIYGRELEKAVELRARLVDARQRSAPWTCDASIYTASRAAESRMLLVGDAASFIEPLSSAGVKKALLSAWRAAVVVNTCLGNPALAGAAMDLYVRRERQVYADCMRRSRVFFAEAAAAYDTPFWSARAELGDGIAMTDGGTDAADVTDEALARDADVRLAFDHLRASDRVRLRPAAALRFEPIAAIEGREIVMRDALVVPGLEAPLQFAAGVNLPALARLATACDEVPALIAAYHAQVGPVPVAGLLTGLSLLVARRALVAEGWTS